jgi:hypothetical protein
MIAIKKRLDSLEFDTERYHEMMANQAKKELGLPLPPCSDLAEGRKRLKSMLDSIGRLPLGVDDPNVDAIVTEFTDWVKAEHLRQEAINGE